eukprot:TRINITY_DN2829_c2_g4_i1.p1 TRINITY_DN2829_c2_g4~~TRINITY_DN2829_c2_g4_i1.p1  ORF type:complete len:101 (+),score=10.31 TRINITY_DN2829_c2_g4_i1:122-424(+)
MHKANYPVKMKEKGRLGQILLDFFELYGKLFNYITTGIRIVDSHGYCKYTRADIFTVPFPINPHSQPYIVTYTHTLSPSSLSLSLSVSPCSCVLNFFAVV